MTTSSTKIRLPGYIFNKDWTFEELFSYLIRKDDEINFRRYDVNAPDYFRFRVISWRDPNWLDSMSEWKNLIYLDCGNKSGEKNWNLWLDTDNQLMCKLVLVPIGTPGFGNDPCRRRGWTLLASTRKDKWHEMVGAFSLEVSLLDFKRTSNYKISKYKEDYKNALLLLRSIWQEILRRDPA